MKNILLFISSLIVFLSFNLNVKAYSLDSFSIFGRSSLPFTTGYNAGESNSYTSSFFLFKDIGSLPSYAYFTTCATGPLRLTTTSISGSVSFVGYKSYGSCNVSGYSGSYYLYTFNINVWDDAGNGNKGVTFKIDYLNNNDYYIPFTGLSLSFSDTLDYSEIDISQNEDIIKGQEQVNENLEDINNSITDESPPNTDGLNGAAGWLPAGPVDSLINLPLSFFNSLTRDLGSSCKPVSLPLPFVNKPLTLPCMSTFYDGIKINSFMDWVGLISSGFILFSYLLKLYKWVDDTLTFRENNHLDNWGGV